MLRIELVRVLEVIGGGRSRTAKEIHRESFSQHHPKAIDKVLTLLCQYDLIAGQRYRDGRSGRHPKRWRLTKTGHAVIALLERCNEVRYSIYEIAIWGVSVGVGVKLL